jgi:outer membrane protein OmpA-like peptidoglycan-associated protein
MAARAQERLDADAIAAALRPFMPRAAPGVTIEDEWDLREITCTPIRARGVFYDEGAKVVRRPRLALEVNFAFGSAELTADAISLLDELAEALKRPDLMRDRFLLVGHTDAVGSDHDNLALSRARAHAVYDHLTRAHGIDPARLRDRGCGESFLLDSGDPNSPKNRRVEVINAGQG